MTGVPLPPDFGSAIISRAGSLVRNSGAATQAVSGAAWGAGMTVGRGAMNLIATQKKPVLLLLLTIAAGFIHYVIDYSYFSFQNNFFRTVMYAIAATLGIGMLMSGQQNSRGTIAAVWWSFIIVVPVSIAIYSISDSALMKNGGSEVLLGLSLFLIMAIKPNLFGSSYDPGPVRVFLFTAFLMPYISQGIIFNFVTTGWFAALVPQMQYVMSHYITPMFFPIAMFYLVFFQSYIERPAWMMILIVAVVLAFSAPIWIDYYNGNFGGLNSSGGTTADQKATAVRYLDEVSTSGISYLKTGWKSTTTSVSCWWYDKSGQFNSLSGQSSSTDPKYAICNKVADTTNSTDFEMSVESGALSASTMSLGMVTGAQQKYYQSQDTTFLTTFKAQAFDTKLPVEPLCSYRLSSDEKKQAQFFASETTNFSIEGSAQQDIVCTIPAGRLKPGKSYEFVSGVSFDYVTSAYLSRYFTTTEALSSFKSGSASAADNLIAFYGANPKPVSKSTKGPIKVGISAENSLIVFEPRTSPNKKEFTIVVAMDNQNSWKGKMQEVKTILLSLPKGIELKEKSSTVLKPKPPVDNPKATPIPSWSNYQCSVGGFVGNFQLLTDEMCTPESRKGTDLESFNDLDCIHYNYYFFTPGYGSGKSAIEVSTGAELTQKPFVTCQAIAADSSVLLAKNTNFATKSIQARVKYKYLLEQSRSFKIELPRDGESTVFSDTVLSTRALCGTPDMYSLEPNLLYSFFQNGVRETTNTKSKEYDKNIIALNTKLTAEERSALLNTDCPTRTIALASISQDWSRVQGNPMVSGYEYGYLRANKKMIDYLLAKSISIGGSASTSLTSTSDIRYTDSTQLDTYLRENSVLVATTYLAALAREDSGCKSPTTGKIDYSCVVGKFKCGAGYNIHSYSQCSVSNCQFCEETTATDIMTLASQISQISMQTLGVPVTLEAVS